MVVDLNRRVDAEPKPWRGTQSDDAADLPWAYLMMLLSMSSCCHGLLKNMQREQGKEELIAQKVASPLLSTSFSICFREHEELEMHGWWVWNGALSLQCWYTNACALSAHARPTLIQSRVPLVTTVTTKCESHLDLTARLHQANGSQRHRGPLHRLTILTLLLDWLLLAPRTLLDRFLAGPAQFHCHRPIVRRRLGAFLRRFRFLRQKSRMHIWQNATLAQRDVLEKVIELLVVPYRERNETGGDSSFLICQGVSREME